MEEEDKKQFEEWKKTKGSISKIVLKSEKPASEKVEKPDKPKRERSEKQKATVVKMREALEAKRKLGPTKHVHSVEYKKEMDDAYEQADKVQELLPNAKIIVKSRVGRPKGRIIKETPTPAVVSDSEEEYQEEIKPSKVVKPSRQLKVETGRQLPCAVLDYMRKLNGH